MLPKPAKGPPLLTRLAERSAEIFRRWLPDPFVFAVLLTILTALTAMVWVGAGPAEILTGWYEGFWTLLEFGMQMVLIVATGYAIALSPAARHAIDRLAARVKGPDTVYVVVLLAGGLMVLVSWGWMALTAVLGRELALRIRGLNYPYLVACVYLSMLAWVCGLSSSIPLLLNTPNNIFLETGLLPATIPVSQTLGSPLNLLVLATFLVGSPLIGWLLRPRGELIAGGPGAKAETTVEDEAQGLRASEPVPSDRFNGSRALQAILVAMGAGAIGLYFARSGFEINLNIMIFIFLVTGMLLHGTPLRYVVAMKRACSNLSGIVYQYPFYAGIMGIMMATGLGKAMASSVASLVSLETLPVAAYALGGLVNFSIPSAGGEWVVIGPPLVEAVRELTGGASGPEFTSHVARVALAVAYGETMTNLLQPFYLLIVLPVMGDGRLQARDVVGYLVVPFLVLSVLVGLLVAFVPLSTP